MPFKEGNSYGGSTKGKKKVHDKSFWLLNALQEEGVDFQRMLAKFMVKASHGDKGAIEMVATLAKFMPYAANLPKNNTEGINIETLVINRISSSADAPSPVPTDIVDTITDSIHTDGLPPLLEDVNEQS